MANEFTTYDQVGKAEEVSKEISMIDPFDTPFQTLIGSKKVKSRNPEWQEDSLAAPADMMAPAVEGAVYVESARAATSMRSNITEILRTAFHVTETSDTITLHGRASEVARELSKAGKELKRAYEMRLLAYEAPDSDAVAGLDADVASSSTARSAGNVWGESLASARQFETGNAAAAILQNRSAATTTQVVFNEESFMAGMLVTYKAGAEGKVLMVSPETAGMIDTWATLPAGRFRDIGQEKGMNLYVDLLKTRYGDVKVVVNRWLGYTEAGAAQTGDAANAALLIDPSYWQVGVLRPWSKIKLAKTSDSERYALRGEFTLIHKNFDEGYGWVNLDAPVAA